MAACVRMIIPTNLVVKEVEGLCEAKDERGRGCYGAVYEVRVDGVPCIAKRLHDILVGRKGMEPVDDEQRTGAINCFRRECNILSGLRHPNVVQFMGVHCGSDEADISLIMEYMHMDLEHCMKTYRDIPYQYKISILRDVAYGLAYLHSHNIIHRDLNAGNILLTESLRAKIADLGVAKLFDRETVMKHTTTVAPGALDFMPPESTASPPNYDCQLDIFSFGHLTVYLVNQKAPIVADRLVTASDVEKKQMQVAKRREALDRMSHQLGGSHHPLYSTVVQCLSDTPDQRPTSRDLVKTMEEICQQHPIPYRNSLGPLAALAQQGDEIKSLTDKCLNLEQSMDVSEKVSKARQKDIDILTDQLIIAKFEAQTYKEDFEQERKDREIARGELATMLAESRQLGQQPMAINRIHCELNGELEGGNRRSQQRIEDLNVIITKLKSVTQTLESQLEEKKREYDELQQRCKMLEQKLEQIQLVPEKTEAAGSIKDDKKVEKRIQADEMITGKGKEEEEKKEEERKTEETETTPPLMLHALNVAHNQPKKSFKPTQPVLSPTHQPVSPQPERVVQPVSHQPERVVPRPKPRSKVPRPRPESAVLSPAPQPVSPQPVVLQQPTSQAELPSTTEHHRRSRCNSTPEGMDTYRLPTSQSATLPRQTVMETEESSPHQLQKPAGVQLQPAGMINELTQKLARRRRWEETEEKQ